ncbi:carboxypeptidase-like regulatory domain-containing protein [Polaribacter sp.]|uniref:carboxypeptidase-like regulatory domain-containing protein n=1 Tax=Polaribacter sp. TaxID=1920175 RepID=UPI003EF5156B
MVRSFNNNYSIIISVIFLLISLSTNSQKTKNTLEGLVVDEENYEIPYASILIRSKNIGTSTTDDGTFSLSIPTESLSDSLEISSMGFNTLKIKINDFLKLKKKVIKLTSNVVSLGEITLISPTAIYKKAIKNLKNTTLRDTHLLKILYRRASVEGPKARFFVEHYMNVLDKGPYTSGIKKIQVVQGRKSADYRFIKKKQRQHAIEFMVSINPIRNTERLDDFKWTKVGDSFYDGEDIIIIKGANGKKKWAKLYIGLESFAIYKVEYKYNNLNSIYIYKKNNEGKLYLSYHQREFKSKQTVTLRAKKNQASKRITIPLAYRHEAFVLSVATDKDKIKFRSNYQNIDMGEYKAPYNPNFWKNISLPPDTAFGRKIKKELQEISGVPIETQFQQAN